MHDKDGDHQVSSELYASSPEFSSDGRSLYFLMRNGQTPGQELRVKDLVSEKVDRVLPGYPMQSYSISKDGKEIAFAMKDPSGRSNLWIAPTNRRSSPVHISSAAVEDSPFFLPDGDVVFRAIEGGSNFLYRMKADGTGRRKVTPERILDCLSVSPDGHWVVAVSPGSDDNPWLTKAIPVDGGAAVLLCANYCLLNWDAAGRSAYLSFYSQASRSLAVIHDVGLPKIPPGGFARLEDIPNAKTNAPIPSVVESALNPLVYAYSRKNTRRNLYRIQLP
jgi:hypothetical protein